MSTFLQRFMVCLALVAMPFAVQADDYQLPDPGFEDWSGSAFDGEAQPKYWHGSNVEQVGFKFNFTHKETGRSGSCLMVQDQKVGALGITETGPGYFSLGTAWQHLEGVNTGSATAGTKGGYAFKHRPDTISVWIKRTGSNAELENYNIVYYSWIGTAEGTTYKNKNGGCTGVTIQNEESDIRRTMDANECNTKKAGEQVGEAWKCEKKQYNNWTNIRIPVFYMDDRVPEMCNLIFSASNYPNFRANSGLYEGNSLYVDDVELIYSSKIHKLLVDGKEWKGFDPNSSEEQVYFVKEGTTKVPEVAAYRGVGSLTNEPGHGEHSRTYNFFGRKLSGSEISIVNGTVGGTPTVITVKSEDGKSTTVYKIKFQAEASSNAKLAGISYTFTDMQGKEQTKTIANFNPGTFNYEVELPYGSQGVPSLAAEKQEDEQTFTITQPTSLTGTGTIAVTAANGKNTQNYKVTFKIGLLADNTLKDIKVNGKSIPGFTPSQAVYKVSQPTGTKSLTIEPVSAYPEGQQTIVITPNPLPTGDAIDGSSVQVSVTTPGNTVAKVYKLNIRLEASSYTYLQNLQAGDYITNFAPDNFTYYVSLPLGTTKLPLISYELGDEYQKVQVSELGEGVVDGTVRVTVTAGNGDQTVYKIVYTTEKSDNSELADIQVGGVSIEGFDPAKTSYTYQLPIGTTVLPEIEVVKGDEYEHVQITPGTVNGTTRITVTAGNGNTTIYLITFSVEAYTDNTLKMIYVGGVELANFDPETNEYSVTLEKGASELPVITFDKQDEDLQTVNTRSGGLNGDYKITVRPQSGASRTYIIHFSVDASNNNKLADILVGGTSIEGFDADVLNYKYILPEGESTIPAVTFKKGEESQRVLSVLEDTTQTITVTAESGDKRIYTVDFCIQLSANAFLKMIYLNGNPIATPFDSSELNYKLPLTGSTCPAISVDKYPGQQVTITSPVGAGTAVILVAPEQGAAQRYSITFEPKAAATVQLKKILVDGEVIEGWDPTKSHYTAGYEKELPSVTYEAEDDQTVQVMWVADQVFLHVSDMLGNTASYDIAFTRAINNNTALAAIKADGVLISGWDKAKKHYTFPLAAGSTYPELSYKKGDEAQVVAFGQSGEGQWNFLVTADNGDTTLYSVQYKIDAYADVAPENIILPGMSGFVYNPAQTDYSGFELDEGAPLPSLEAIAKPKQKIVCANLSETQQAVYVTAENGDQAVYTISYTRKKSDNAQLAAILINGDSLAGFNPSQFSYTDSLEWRTKVMPNIFPVAGNKNQTIVTEYCRPNGTAKITVYAQDFETHADHKSVYTIAFPVRQSSNTALEDLYLIVNDNQEEINFNPEKTVYEYAVDYQATECPRVEWEKQEPEQRVDLISRPLGDTTEVKVTAENGEERIYKIYFKETLSTKENVLKSLTIEETNKRVDLKSNAERKYEINLPYNSKSLTVSYVKNYDEQTVFVQPGGIKDTTFITVKANRGDEEDVVYKLVPKVDTQNPAVLDTLKIDGVDIPGFDKNRFTYVFNVADVGQIPQITYVEYDSKAHVSAQQNLWQWEATVTAQGYSNTYRIFWHYPNEKIPNEDFTEWVDNAAGSQKPKGWNATNDYVTNQNAKDYVTKHNATIVQLYTSRSSTLDWAWSNYGAAPAMLNLATMAAHHVVSGGSRTTVEGTIDFHNTPDKAVANYSYPNLDQDKKGAVFRFYFMDNYGTAYEKSITQTSTTSTFADHSVDLQLDGKRIKGFDVIIDASSASLNGGKGADGSKLQVDYIHFLYNSTPKEAWVNGTKATLKSKEFTVKIDDPEDVNIRSYEFNGEVSDQAQKLNGWTNKDGDEDYAVRTTTFRNFAEDGSYTDGYSLTVKRAYSTDNKLKQLLVGGKAVVIPANGIYACHLQSTEKNLPDVYPVPNSLHQKITCAYADSTMTITVKPEKGSDKVYKVRFITDLSDDTALASVKVGDKTLTDAEMTARAATVTANVMPDITFEKKSDLQKVVVNDGIITVTAENGAVGTYTITRKDVAPVLGSGQIENFEVNGNVVPGFGGTSETITIARPNSILFTYFEEEKEKADSIAFTQTPEKMTWDVYGKDAENNHLYTLNYANDGLDNAALSAIFLNDESYAIFNPTTYDYNAFPIASDSILLVDPIAANSRQKIAITQTASVTVDTLDYTIDVTSADNSKTVSYKLRVVRPISSDHTLKAIYADGVLIDGFRPDSTEYTIVLPSPAVKTAQPQMPSITYLAGHKAQTIEFTAGELGETLPTMIDVTSEDGSGYTQYKVKVIAEKSHCADLTGIMVNGIAVEDFEPGRHNYSIELNTSDIEIAAAAQDRFQTIDTIKNGYNRTLHVTAEDGVTTSDYQVKIYVQAQSGDATLSGILLEQDDAFVELVDFQRALNPTLKFDPMQHSYTINLPAGSTIPPAVSATLKMDGQKVDIKKDKMVVTITVAAVDGTKNDYTLNFEVPKSKNADLSMIFLDGDSLKGFTPDYYFYQVNLPVGTHSLPEVVGQKGEARQTLDDVAIDTDKLQATLHVTAEDPSMDNTYVVVFHYTQSDADTLNKVFEDGLEKINFLANEFYYNDSLPVGTLAFPELSWEEADEWQTIVMDTVQSDANTLIRRIHVTSESGKKNTYLFTYTIRKSTADTLQMLYVDTKPLPGFTPLQNEYYYELTAAQANELTEGQLPNIEFLAADTLQKVMISQAKDSLSGKSLGYKSIITVTAPSGAMRTYTIHYPVELSTDATLNMINVSGKPLSNFDAERFIYRLEIEKEASVPVVSVIKKEDAQTYDISVIEDTVQIVVFAEDMMYQNTYTLTFERLKSAVTTLRDIILTDESGEVFPSSEFPYRPEVYSYIVNLTYDDKRPLEEQLPTIEPVGYDEEQVTDTTMHYLPNGDIQVDVTVTAPNGEDQAIYSITFHFVKPADATLASLTIGGNEFADFRPTKTGYIYYHPYGTDEAAYFTEDDVLYLRNDSLATDSIFTDENGIINIVVTAQDGRTTMTYQISQETAEDGDNALQWITINGDTVAGFDPETLFYTYYMYSGDATPAIDAAPRSINAEVDLGQVKAGDTCTITCTAADGQERLYRIHFAISSIQPGADASSNDVLIKRVPGSYQYMAATMRNGVTIALYDQNGRMVYYGRVPVANANETDVVIDANNKEKLNNVNDINSGLLIDIIPGQPYFYSFFWNEKTMISSGKLMAY